MRSPPGPQRSLLLAVGLLGLLLCGASDGIRMMESPAHGLGLKEDSQIVAQHNRLRSRVQPTAANMQKMEWSEELASLAQQRAWSCQANASHYAAAPFHHIGWNTHAAAHAATSFSQVVRRWFEEGLDYVYLRGRCREDADCQHYKQVVWATSSHVGCARRVCVREPDQRWDFYVCSYSPGGNWEVNGRSLVPYTAGVSCSLCTSSRSGCFRLWDHVGGLCEIPKNPCRMDCGQHGRLNVSSCKCTCDPGFTGIFCQVRCSVQCVHGRYRAEQCSCQCDLGYGGPECAEKLRFPVRSCDVRIDGDCFMVSPGADAYYAAKSRCQERGGMLAQIHNQKVQDVLAFYLGLETGNHLTHLDQETGNHLTHLDQETGNHLTHLDQETGNHLTHLDQETGNHLTHLDQETGNHLTHLDQETRNLWIGLTYKSVKDSFRWDTGEPLTFSSFAFGQPDNQGFGNCVEMQASSGFNWNDQRCKTRNRYICQYAPHHVALWNVGG